MRSGGRYVYPGSMGNLACAQSVIMFIRCRCVHSHLPWRSLGSLAGALGVVGFIQVHLTAPWVWLSSSRVIRFARTHPGYRSVQPESLGSFVRAQGVVGFTGAPPAGRWVHPMSLGSLACAVWFVRFIRCRYAYSRAP